ncbi:MAG: AAA-like domain-containing protein [Calothrix sp. FI2-JRJ7]|jgi:DNA-binding Xre family transcriptional regulator|nr:AAA-like domain-containing protein [Calothrix sp. FI2-JRJ7]
MPRSIRVRSECISQVKSALPRNGYVRQTDLAESLQISQSTVSSFLNGRPVDFLNFTEICRALGLEWQNIANFSSDNELVVLPSQQNRGTQYQLELPEGQVELTSAFYINRPPIEARCYEEIKKLGSLIRIKAPRQMGKTSLMARILNESQSQGSYAVTLDFQLASQQIFTSADKFLRWFCASVAKSVNIQNQLDNYWDLAGILGSNMACKAYFEEYLLPSLDKPLTLGLDEVDRVFEYPDIYRDFFGLLRALHEEAKRRDVWKKLRLIIVHSTEVYVPLDINQSPFNVGLPIELPEFTHEQILELTRRHQLEWGDTEVEQLMSMIGGHPFLVRLALYYIACGDVDLQQVLQTAAIDTGIYKDYLRHQLLILTEQPELLAAMKQVAAASSYVKLPSLIKFKLHSLGLVQMLEDEVAPRCQLHRLYFSSVQM